MIKKKTSNLTLGAILAIMVISITLALSTFAFAQTTGVNQDPEPEIPDVQKGNIRLDVQRPDLGTIQYKIDSN